MRIVKKWKNGSAYQILGIFRMHTSGGGLVFFFGHERLKTKIEPNKEVKQKQSYK